VKLATLDPSLFGERDVDVRFDIDVLEQKLKPLFSFLIFHFDLRGGARLIMLSLASAIT
jgi:hypothetical protein